MSVLRIILLGLLGASLSFCSSAPKEEGTQQDNHNNYSSSGVFESADKASADTAAREPGAKGYSDDAYGDIESGESGDALYLGDDQGTEVEAEGPGATSLPVIDEPDDVSHASVSDFKDGMYHVTSTCTLRAEPNHSSSSEGPARQDIKLWMEKHDSAWVKLFKKSGPVFLSRDCL